MRECYVLTYKIVFEIWNSMYLITCFSCLLLYFQAKVQFVRECYELGEEVATTNNTTVKYDKRTCCDGLKFKVITNTGDTAMVIKCVRRWHKIAIACLYCLWDVLIVRDNWAVTCDFQQCGILTSVDSDKPVQPPVKLRNSKLCSVSSLTLIKYSSD